MKKARLFKFNVTLLFFQKTRKKPYMIFVLVQCLRKGYYLAETDKRKLSFGEECYTSCVCINRCLLADDNREHIKKSRSNRFAFPLLLQSYQKKQMYIVSKFLKKTFLSRRSYEDSHQKR